MCKLKTQEFVYERPLIQRFIDSIVRRLVSISSLKIAENISYSRSIELLTRLYPYDSGHTLLRLGPNGDGGYLVPDDLDGITHCFSPGVAAVSVPARV